MGVLLITTLLVSLLHLTVTEHQENSQEVHSVELRCKDGGEAPEEQVRQVEKSIGDLRWRLVKRNQTNGPGGDKMPKPKEMREVFWNCSLEKEAIAELLRGRCSEDVHPTPTRTELTYRLTGQNQTFAFILDFWAHELDKKPMKKSAIGTDSVTYEGDFLVWEYVNVS
ncbi:hypothetical protein Aduo_000713 [Ancylostoma duodenale]